MGYLFFGRETRFMNPDLEENNFDGVAACQVSGAELSRTAAGPAVLPGEE